MFKDGIDGGFLVQSQKKWVDERPKVKGSNVKLFTGFRFSVPFVFRIEDTEGGEFLVSAPDNRSRILTPKFINTGTNINKCRERGNICVNFGKKSYMTLTSCVFKLVSGSNRDRCFDEV